MILRIRLHMADFWLFMVQRQEEAARRAVRLAHRRRARLIAQLPPESIHA